MVWLILLGICGLIAVAVAPISGDNSYLMTLVISLGKLLVTAVAILFWLVAWYKLMEMTIVYEFTESE